MSKGFLRGLSFGIILTTLLFFIFSDADGKVRTEEFTLNEQTISFQLKKNGKTAITLDEYNHLKQIEKEYTNIKNSKNATSTKDNSSNNEPKVESEDRVLEQEEVVLYTLEIKQGMTISEISNKLEEVKVVRDAKELEEYLKKQGWEGSIQIGTFEVTSKMTLEEIARVITKQ